MEQSITKPLQVDIVSYVVCPWRTIDYSRFQRALDILQSAFTVNVPRAAAGGGGRSGSGR